MNHLSIRESSRNMTFGGMKFPKLKGHVKIRLYDPKSGITKKTIEGDNIVTDAIPDILKNNYMGGVYYNNLFGENGLASSFFGGILAFHDPFSTVTIDDESVPDPTKYYPQGDDVNALIAHAGDLAPASASIVREDFKRGQPIDIIRTSHSLKQVWEWNTNQGNGVISALALTHKDVGNAGLGNTSSAFKALVPFQSIGNLTVGDSTQDTFSSNDAVFCQYDDTHGLIYTIGGHGDWIRPFQFSTNKVTIYKKRLPYKKVGMFENWHNLSSYVEKFTITSPNITFYRNPWFYFDYENKYLWLFTNATGLNNAYDKTNIKYIVIDCVNEVEINHGTIVSDANDIAPLGFVGLSNWNDNESSFQFNIIKDGNCFYFPTSNGVTTQGNFHLLNVKGYRKINIVNNDQEDITFNEVQGVYSNPKKNGGLIISSGATNNQNSYGRVVNGGVGYTCGGVGYADSTVDMYSEPEDPSSVVVGTTRPNRPRGVLASKFLLSTKYNLDESVEKVGTVAMTVEYTLEEV